MMKRRFILLTIFLSYASTALQAQDNLPQNFSISLGGGVTLPRVEGNRNDFSRGVLALNTGSNVYGW